MGNLPECRLEPGMVFRNTGVDFFGPVIVKERVVKLKCTVVGFFACLLELAILNWWTIYRRIISLSL